MAVEHLLSQWQTARPRLQHSGASSCLHTLSPPSRGPGLAKRLRYVEQMQIVDTELRDVKLIRPELHGDDRGWFAEIFNAPRFEAAGLPGVFVQDNQSHSTRGVLRGLHYQVRQPQGKLLRVLAGEIWDVVVDLRRNSPEFGHWAAFELHSPTPDNGVEMLWVPGGYAHGFLVLSETADVLYKVTAAYDPRSERTLLWNDPELRIPWPLDALGAPPSVSAKDAAGLPLVSADTF